MKLCTKFHVKIPNTFKVISYLQFSVDGLTDGRTYVRMYVCTEGLNPITARKPTLKPRNIVI